MVYLLLCKVASFYSIFKSLLFIDKKISILKLLISILLKQQIKVESNYYFNNIYIFIISECNHHIYTTYKRFIEETNEVIIFPVIGGTHSLLLYNK